MNAKGDGGIAEASNDALDRVEKAAVGPGYFGSLRTDDLKILCGLARKAMRSAATTQSLDGGDGGADIEREIERQVELFGDVGLRVTEAAKDFARQVALSLHPAEPETYSESLSCFEPPEDYCGIVEADPEDFTSPSKGVVERLREALVSHNDVLRSACQVADRDGRDTNWLSLRGAIHYTLAEYHELTNEAVAAIDIALLSCQGGADGK